MGVGSWWNAPTGEVRGEDVHGHVDQHRPRAPGLGQMERALDRARQVFHPVHAVHALAERPEDLELIGVLVQVHFLVGVAAVVVGRHVAGDHDHRDRVQGGVGHAGGGVGQSRPEVREQHARLARGARVAVRGMGGHLLVARGDEPDPALSQRVQEGDHGVPAQAEDHLDPQAFQVFGQQIGRDARLRPARRPIDV